jgi:hypothetical protein
MATSDGTESAMDTSQDSPLHKLDKILTKYASFTTQWSESTYQLFQQAINDNLDLIASIPKNQLIKTLGSFKDQNVLVTLRLELFVHLTKVHKNDEYELAERSKNHEDIYHLIHLITSKPVQINDATWRKFSKKKAQKKRKNNELDSESIITLLDEIIENNEYHLEEIDDLKSEIFDLKDIIMINNNKLDAILAVMQNLTKENKELKSTIGELRQQKLQNDPSSNPTNNNTVQTPSSTNFIKKAPQGNLNNNYNNSQSPRNLQQKQSFANTLQINKNQIVNYNNRSTQQALKAYDSTNPSMPNTNMDDPNNEYSGPWTVANAKNKNRQQPASKYIKTLGTAQVSTNLVAPRLQKVFIGNLDLGTDVDKIKSFLNEITCEQAHDKKLPYQDVEEAPIKNTRAKAFTFFIPYQFRDIVTDRSKWPIGMRVDYSHRPRTATVILAPTTQSTTTN